MGLVVGSFLNVVIYRLPRMMEQDWRRQCQALLSDQPDGLPASGPPAAEADPEPYNLVRPRSACPACGAAIRPLHNIPVLSWLWLRGRCAACNAAIGLRYPVVELLTALVSLLVAWRYGPGLACAGALLLSWALIALAVIDLDHHLLPDAITLPLLWAGLLFQMLAGESGAFASLSAGVLGAVAGYLSLWTIYHGFRLLTGKEGMGYGDFKLFAALGAWLGWQLLPLIILLSALTGAVTGIAMIAAGRHAREKPIPFGPYLAGAGFIALLWGRELVTAYLGTMA